IGLMMQSVASRRAMFERLVAIAFACVCGVIAWLGTRKLSDGAQVAIASGVAITAFAGFWKIPENWLGGFFDQWTEKSLEKRLHGIGVYSAHDRFSFDWQEMRAQAKEGQTK